MEEPETSQIMELGVDPAAILESRGGVALPATHTFVALSLF